MKRHWFRALLVTAMAACIQPGLLAQEAWPTKPIRLIVGFQAGGGADTMARTLAPRLSALLQQPVIVENRAGASGRIAHAELVKSAPDGYTLLLDPPGIAMNPSIYRKVPYDPFKDLQPVAQVASLGFVVTVNPRLPYKTLAELIAHAKQHSGAVNIAIAGPTTRMVAELFMLQTGTRLTLIPYKGSAPAAMSVIGGETQLLITDATSVSAHVASGQLRALAVTAPRRLNSLPEVPTVREASLPSFEIGSWFGVFVPAGTPTATVTRLNEAINRVLSGPDVQGRFEAMGAVPVTSTVDQFSQFFRREVTTWKDVATRAAVPMED